MPHKTAVSTPKVSPKSTRLRSTMSVRGAAVGSGSLVIAELLQIIAALNDVKVPDSLRAALIAIAVIGFFFALYGMRRAIQGLDSK